MRLIQNRKALAIVGVLAFFYVELYLHLLVTGRRSIPVK